MKTDFTFGISEIDHLARHRIESQSFFLLAGNDDEGMQSFLAEIENYQGRPAKKEQKSWQFIRADLKNPTLLDEIANDFLTVQTEQRNPADQENPPQENQAEQENLPQENQAEQKNPPQENQTDQDNRNSEKQNIICVLENLSDFSNSKEETADLLNLLKKAVALIKNTEGKREIIFIAVLYEGIFPASFENQLKHLADSYFQFEMTKKYTDFERTLSIWKYKDSNMSGKILRYTLQDGGFQIENKKRVY